MTASGFGRRLRARLFARRGDMDERGERHSDLVVLQRRKAIGDEQLRQVGLIRLPAVGFQVAGYVVAVAGVCQVGDVDVETLVAAALADGPPLRPRRRLDLTRVRQI